MTKFNPTATKALKIDYPLIFSLNTCNLSTIYHNILIIELKLRYLAAAFYFVLKNFMTPILLLDRGRENKNSRSGT